MIDEIINVNVTVHAWVGRFEDESRPEQKLVIPVNEGLLIFPDLTEWRLAAYIGKLFCGFAERITFEYSILGSEKKHTWVWWDGMLTEEDDTPQIDGTYPHTYGQDECRVCLDMYNYIKEEVYIKLTTPQPMEEDEVEDDTPRCWACEREW